jgi:hypothetical protein
MDVTVDLDILLPHEEDAELVRDCVQHLSPEATHASVRPLGRYGYTDSRLYLVYCAPNRGGIPFVIKTDRPDVIEREARGVRRLRVYFTGAHSADIFPSEGAPKAVIYPLVAIDGNETVRELREIVYQPSEGSSESPSSSDLLKRTYGNCRRAHATRPASFAFGKEYAWYLRETSERLLSDPLPSLFSERSSIKIYGFKLNDPRRILHRIKEHVVDSQVCPVHGDLHPNNVLFGPELSPVLIDYAFGHLNGHFIKDFVLMECSLRFLLPPKLLQPEIVTELDEMLLQESGYQDFEMPKARGRTTEVVTEMISLVDTIRSECRYRAPQYDFTEYLIAQYMVLLGNLKLLPYQDFRTLLAVCRLADYLDSQALP